MSAVRHLTRGRIVAAISVAAIADLVQLPFSLLFFTGVLSVPAEAGDICVDVIAFALTTVLLGFHWLLLPTFALELVPVVGALPTWTGCVLLVIWNGRRRISTPARTEPAKPEPRQVDAERVAPRTEEHSD